MAGASGWDGGNGLRGSSTAEADERWRRGFSGRRVIRLRIESERAAGAECVIGCVL